jgi:MFS transporter, YNFM family, putative membrane transport protein
MTEMPLDPARSRMDGHGLTGLARSVVICLIAFLTLVDLFATQAILPSLTRAYGVTPAAMSFAVNASTLGMAIAAVGMSLFGRRVGRRTGIVVSLAVLTVPTALLAVAPDLNSFTLLRIAQGLCMASAFTLTLAHLGERCSAVEAGSAFAAYITGNVASNLVGRLVSAAVADHLGIAWNFYFFAGLNLAGAMLAWLTLSRSMTAHRDASAGAEAWLANLRNTQLLIACAIGFCILFAFIGTFTYVNFVLARPPLSVNPMSLGLVYFVFLPSVVTTLLAGSAVSRFGTHASLWGSLAAAGIGLPLLLLPSLTGVLAGLVLVGIGTFFAQAIATGFVGRAASADRAAASGLYLASYFSGGLIGTAVLGQTFQHAGWTASVAAIGGVLLIAGLLALGLHAPRHVRVASKA